MPKSDVKLSVGFLFDDTLDSNDGVAQYVKTLGAWLSRQGHEVCYLVGETTLDEWAGGKVYSLAANRPVTFNGNRLSIPMPADKKRIQGVLNQRPLDILHVMLPYSPFMAQRVINLTSIKTAIVGTFHIYPSGVLSTFGARLLKLALRRSLARFSEVVSVSSAAAKFAKQSFGFNTPVVPNTVDLSTYSNVEEKPKPGYRIVFLGRLVKRKGARQLLEAFALLSKSLPQASLVITGDGPQRRDLENFVKRSGLKEKVQFLGYIEESQKPRLLASADLACFPSLYGESFGIVLLEAMAAGSIVLGGDNPGYRSVLGKQPVLLINPQSSRLFASRLEELLVDQSLRRDILEWQNNEIKQYDIEVVGQRILNTYKAAIARQIKKSHNKRYE